MPVPAASLVCCIHRRSTLSFSPKLMATWLIGFSRFKANATQQFKVYSLFSRRGAKIAEIAEKKLIKTVYNPDNTVFH